MPIRVLLADDSACMLSAIRQVLQEEPRIRIVAEASTFASTMQMIGDFKPEVLLFDLHMGEKRNFTPAFVKSQLVSMSHTLAMSFANDAEAKALAESYGVTLLDKMNLYVEMIPAIIRCCSNRDSEFVKYLRKPFKRKGHAALRSVR
jgi:DNA-binding NarL/FixJ family response regulator